MNGETTRDRLRFHQAGKVGNVLGKPYTASTWLHEVLSALWLILKDVKEEKSKVADTLTKKKKRYKQARVRVAAPREAKVSELGEKIDTLTDEVEAKNLELQTTSMLVEDSMRLQNEAAELSEAVVDNEANVTDTS